MNKDYFFSLLRDQGLSLREMARRLELPPSQVSMMFSGKRKMQLGEAVNIARMLGVTLHDVAIQAGIESARMDRVRVKISGIMQGDGVVRKPERVERTTAPSGLPENIKAMRVESAGSPFEWIDGFVLFCGPAAPPDEMIGRFCWVKIEGGDEVVASVRRGYERGLYGLSGPFSATWVKLEWCAPVLITRHG